MKIKKNTLYLVTILVIVIIGGFLVMSKGNPQTTGENTGGTAGDVQKITLSMKNYNYYPNTITVKAGQPVEISLDESVGGCFRDFTVREFGIHQYLQTPQEKVTFTPTKPGRYTFACSMGMGQGTLIVE